MEVVADLSKKGFSQSGLPDLSWYNIPKTGKISQITIKYTEWPNMIPKCRKIGRPKRPYNKTTSSIVRTSKIYPNQDFWF
jgi:hypothetical protein